MTIPVQPVTIRPELAPPPPALGEQVGSGLQVVALALQKRQELELARQELAQRQEQFQLQKKLTGTQIAGMELEQEKKKREFKAQDEDLAAQDQALRIFTGNLPTAHDMGAWGQVIANVKDPLVGRHLMENIQAMFTLQGQAGSAQATDLQNQQRIIGMTEDRQIHDVLQPLAGQEWNRRTIGQAVGRVIAINPQKAGQVATALNALLPDYQINISDDGRVTYLPKEPGQPGVGGPSVPPKRPTDEQSKTADYAIRVFNANAIMTDLERRVPDIGQQVDDRLRAVRAVEQVPALGRTAATAITPTIYRTMSKDQRAYAAARIDIANALLRRASGAQINMEELDRETAPYVPIHGEEGDRSIEQQKQTLRLQRGFSFIDAAGTAFNPNRLSPDARGYLLQNIVPHPGYSPDNPYDPNRQPGTTVVPR